MTYLADTSINNSLNAHRQHVDINRLLEVANQPETFIKLLEETHQITDFKKTGNSYRSKQFPATVIYKASCGTWMLNNFSHSTNIPKGNLYNAVKKIYQLEPKGNQSDLLKTCQLIANFSGQVVTYSSTPDAPRPTIIPLVEKEWIPNKERDTNTSYSFTIAPDDHRNTVELTAYYGRLGVSSACLQKYGVRPLLSLTHLLKSHTTKITPDTLTYHIKAGENIKGKRIHPTGKQLKEFYIQSSGNYCFGYDQLPQRGKAVIITAGEKDTLVTNGLMNEYGVYAICFSGERSHIPTSVIQQLKSRFAHGVFICYDNDDTGAKEAVKAAEKHGIGMINISEYHKVNDVTDVYEIDGGRSLRDLLCQEMNTKIAISQRKDDPFSIPVPDGLRLDIRRYIGDEHHLTHTRLSAYAQLSKYISEQDNILLDAPTGTGKTWFFMKLSTDKNFMQKSSLKQIVFCVPTTAIATQVSKDYFSNYGVSPPVIMGKTSEEEIREAYDSPFIITTYDSVKKALYHIDESLLVVDEVQELRNAENYRGVAVRDVLECMRLAKKTALVSATPPYIFCSDAVGDLKCKLVKVFCQRSQKVIINPVVYLKGTESDVLKHRLLDIEKNHRKGSVHIIKKNNIVFLETLKKIIEAKFGAGTATIISSKKAAYKSTNPHYNNIMETGKVNDPNIIFILTTSLLDAGTSFKFDVGSCTMINPVCMDNAIQHLARARYTQDENGKDINETVQVYTYHTYKKSSEESLRQIATSQQELAYWMEYAGKQVEQANTVKGDENRALYKFMDEAKYVTYSNTHGRWEINLLKILYDEYERQRKGDSLNTFYQRIAHYQPHISIKEVVNVDLEADLAVRMELAGSSKATKEQKEKAVIHFREEVARDEINFLHCLYHTTRNQRIKKRINNIVEGMSGTRFSKNIDVDVYDQVINNESIYTSGALDEVAKRYTYLRVCGVKDAVIQSNVDITEAKYKEVRNAIVALTELEKAKDVSQLNGKELVRVQQYCKVIKAVRLKGKKSKKTFTTNELIKLAGTAHGNKKISAKEAVMRIKELYHVETKRGMKDNKGKKMYFHTIIKRKKLSEFR